MKNCWVVITFSSVGCYLLRWIKTISIIIIQIGQPQMIKLVQPSGKTVSGVMTSTIAAQPVKFFKTSAANAEPTQVFFIMTLY